MSDGLGGDSYLLVETVRRSTAELAVYARTSQTSVGGDHWSPGKAGSHRSPPYAMTSGQDRSEQGSGMVGYCLKV